ncbi:hypothetical protein ACFRAQ_13870 [Nocardia sp. NPDC056611]|uniref:hypothetical protein n=1 Tax=Nocardia sp. NPDC056611 TaxID=3345877 RepID=UPI003671965B
MSSARRREYRDQGNSSHIQPSPMGLALLLGHRWNRLRPTVVYEDVNNTAAICPAGLFFPHHPVVSEPDLITIN